MVYNHCIVRTVGIIFLFVAAGILSYGFYWGYKKNLAIMKEISKQLEEHFTPVRKYYTWIGGVIGFEAQYFLLGGKKIHIKLILLPRHAIIYYPIALLINRGDKLYFRGKLDLSEIEEKHVIKKLPNGEVVVEMKPIIEDIKKIKLA